MDKELKTEQNILSESSCQNNVFHSIVTMTDFTYFINFPIIVKLFETTFWEEPSRPVYKPLQKGSLLFIITSHIFSIVN